MTGARPPRRDATEQWPTLDRQGCGSRPARYAGRVAGAGARSCGASPARMRSDAGALRSGASRLTAIRRGVRREDDRRARPAGRSSRARCWPAGIGASRRSFGAPAWPRPRRPHGLDRAISARRSRTFAGDANQRSVAPPKRRGDDQTAPQRSTRRRRSSPDCAVRNRQRRRSATREASGCGKGLPTFAGFFARSTTGICDASAAAARWIARAIAARASASRFERSPRIRIAQYRVGPVRLRRAGVGPPLASRPGGPGGRDASAAGSSP